MKSKLMTLMLLVTLMSVCALQSLTAQETKELALRPDITLTDPGKNVFITITEIDTSSNTVRLGIRIDGGNLVKASTTLQEFNQIREAGKLMPAKAASPKKISKLKYRSPVRPGDSWESTRADAGITIGSQDGDNLIVYIRIDGTKELMRVETTVKEVNAMLSNPSNAFRLKGQANK